MDPSDHDSELSREELLQRYMPKAAAKHGTERRSPFKFLDSYEASDSDIFFGRDSEIDELLRIYHRPGNVLIYGESGAGKTSLVQCGLRARIHQADALFIPLRISKEGLTGVCRDVCAYASGQLGETVEYLPEMSLVDAVTAAREEASRPIVLFFDQFEELLIFHDADDRRRFAGELAALSFIMYTGVVSPLGEGTNRFFDMEALTSLNYLY